MNSIELFGLKFIKMRWNLFTYNENECFFISLGFSDQYLCIRAGLKECKSNRYYIGTSIYSYYLPNCNFSSENMPDVDYSLALIKLIHYCNRKNLFSLKEKLIKYEVLL